MSGRITTAFTVVDPTSMPMTNSLILGASLGAHPGRPGDAGVSLRLGPGREASKDPEIPG